MTVSPSEQAGVDGTTLGEVTTRKDGKTMIYKLFALGFVALAVMWGFSNKYTEATYCDGYSLDARGCL